MTFPTKNTFSIPDEVKTATDTYRGEMDALAEFLNDCCYVDSNSKITSKELYAAYTTWCEDNGEDPLKQRSFALRLKDKGFKQVRIGSNGTRGWKDLSLLT
jgi:putative DNA primase/helicase